MTIIERKRTLRGNLLYCAIMRAEEQTKAKRDRDCVEWPVVILCMLALLGLIATGFL